MKQPSMIITNNFARYWSHSWARMFISGSFPHVLLTAIHSFQMNFFSTAAHRTHSVVFRAYS